jgi:hypothetical protein
MITQFEQLRESANANLNGMESTAIHTSGSVISCVMVAVTGQIQSTVLAVFQMPFVTLLALVSVMRNMEVMTVRCIRVAVHPSVRNALDLSPPTAFDVLSTPLIL